MLKNVRQGLVGSQENVVDSVLVQDFNRLLDHCSVQSVVESSVVHENIRASVNKGLQLGCIPFHIPAPPVAVEDSSVDVLPLHELQRGGRIFFVHFLLELRRRRVKEDQRTHYACHNNPVQQGFIQG